MKNNEEYVSLYFSLAGCSSLKEIPSDLFKYCNNAIGFASMFVECTSLTTIPEELFADCPNAVNFNSTFVACTSLTTISEELFANCPNVVDFSYTFRDCTNLTGKPIELWTRGTNNAENEYQGNPDGDSCYYHCRGLEGYETIPNYWKRMGLSPD